LQINNSTRANLNLSNGTNTISIFQDGVDGYFNNLSSGSIVFRNTSSNLERMRIDANGNVGIGTTTPAYKLDISSATGSGRQDMLRILAGNNTTGTGASIVLGSTQTHAGYISGLQTNSNTGDLAFGTQSNGAYAEKMRIVGSNGNVGIGTATPASKLHIAGADMNNALLFENTSANPGRNYMLFKTQGTEQGYIGLGSGVSNNMYISAYGASNNIFLVTNNIARMTILPSGEVGIGTTTPSQKLDVAGNIKITNQSGAVATPDKIDLGTSYSNGATRDQCKIYLYDAGGAQRYGFGIGASADIQYHSQEEHDFYVDNSKRFSVTGSGGANTSDRRLKRDILPLNKYGLQQVMQLNPVTYIFKDDSANTPQVGFIAQEVQQIIPEVVTGKEGDLSKGESLGIVYGNLVPVLTKAIQEQQATIESLKKLLDAQQKQIDELKSMIEKTTK